MHIGYWAKPIRQISRRVDSIQIGLRYDGGVDFIDVALVGTC
jgi:hypothetical protein